MALTRKALAAMGIEPEKIDQIIEMHTDTVNGLKDDISKYKADAEKLPEVQKEVNNLTERIAKYSDDDEWKSKYDKVQKEFDDYKKAESEKAEMAQKTEAYKSILFEMGLSNAKRVSQILKASADEIKSLNLDENGRPKDAENLKEDIAKEWEGFFPKEGEKGANVANPPANNGGDIKSQADIYKRDERGRFVLDDKQRHEALKANLLKSE